MHITQQVMQFTRGEEIMPPAGNMVDLAGLCQEGMAREGCSGMGWLKNGHFCAIPFMMKIDL